jgi:glycosyltransferase involved in cell wall biosynthesis
MVELSIIIPTYNRAQRLRNCLKALSRQSQPSKDYEVVVVVDGSTDGTQEMLSKLTVPYSLNIIYQNNTGQPTALNRGAAQAIGRYLLFLDDDIIAEDSLVAAHLRMQSTHEDIVCVGRITLRTPNHANWFIQAYAKGWENHYKALAQNNGKISWMAGYSGNLSVPRESFINAGGFATDVARGFDIELSYCLEQQGLKLVYISDAISHQDEQKSTWELASDAEKAGASWAQLCKRHPPMTPHLLGIFSEASPLERTLRHLCSSLNLPHRLLGFLGPFLIKSAWKHKWHRFILNYCYWRGVRRTLKNSNDVNRLASGVPILMYHAFGDRNEPASRYVLPIRKFTKQMAWLKRLGYRVISLREYLDYRLAYRFPPARSVVITIDDGYADNHKLAYPILRQFGFPATIFLVSRSVGSSNRWDRDSVLTNRPLLSWTDVNEMRDNGIDFGAHTRAHSTLLGMTEMQLKSEVHGSKDDLEKKLGIPVACFSYPHGDIDGQAQSAVEHSGFIAACGVYAGLNTFKTPLYALHRTEIFGTDSLFGFVIKVLTGKDLQYFIRSLRYSFGYHDILP